MEAHGCGYAGKALIFPGESLQPCVVAEVPFDANGLSSLDDFDLVPSPTDGQEGKEWFRYTRGVEDVLEGDVDVTVGFPGCLLRSR